MSAAERRSAEGGLNPALLGLGAATAVTGALLLLTSVAELSWWDRWAGVLIGWSYAAVGLVAWWRRPHNRMGPLLVACGWSFLGLELGASTSSTLVAASLVVATVPLAIVLHLLMAFPSGRLTAPLERVIVVVTYGLAIVVQAPMYLLADGPLSLASAPDAVEVFTKLSSVVGTATYFTGAGVLLARLRCADAAQRRVVGPLCAVGAVTLAVVAAVGFIGAFDVQADISTLSGTIQPCLLLVLPLTFLLGLLRGGFERAGEVRELAVRLADAAIDPAALRTAVGEALGDRSVALAYWVAAAGEYVDEDGTPVALPPHGSSRAWVEVVADGRRAGAIVYDGLLISDRGLVRSVAQLTALALEHQRLTAELRSVAAQLRASRQRLAVASDAERRRIARDLHDGAQQRLVVLAIDAQRLARVADDPERVRSGATRLRQEVEAVLDELRDLVHRIEPALLTERGLPDATAWLVARMPIPTELHSSGIDGRLPWIVESTGYFVVAEALANVVKHAQASAVAVELRGNGTHVAIVVRDDGIGGADAAGPGLRGLADRLAAVDGRLVIASPPDRGTRLDVELPLATG